MVIESGAQVLVKFPDKTVLPGTTRIGTQPNFLFVYVKFHGAECLVGEWHEESVQRAITCGTPLGL